MIINRDVASLIASGPWSYPRLLIPNLVVAIEAPTFPTNINLSTSLDSTQSSPVLSQLSIAHHVARSFGRPGVAGVEEDDGIHQTRSHGKGSRNRTQGK
ncbi:hypothetical protein QC760_004900 [Botrytis cinerea]